MDEDLDEYRCCPTHCCIYHGCKYSLPGCPVKNGTTRQRYICEYCNMYDNIKTVEEAVARSKGAAAREFLLEFSKRIKNLPDMTIQEFFQKLLVESEIKDL